MQICKSGHKNIVQALGHDWLQSGSTCFVDLELCTLTLSDYIYRRSEQTSDLFQGSIFVSEDCSAQQKLINIWTIAHHIAQGLDYIHQMGYTHRDLKPVNGK
jgi:serine/threonine protein kinase